MKLSPTLLSLTTFLSLYLTGGADESILVVENPTIVSTGATLFVEDSEGKVTEIKPPEGNYGRDQAVAKLKLGQTARIGGEDGADLILSGEVTARLDPGTIVKFPDPGDKKNVDKKEAEPANSLKLLQGRMFMTVDAEKLKKRGKKEFRLKTPKCVLAVKGTRFVTSADAEIDTTVLLRGTVEAEDLFSKKSGELKVGRAFEFRPNGALSVRALDNVEKGYQQVFDKYELSFLPLTLDHRKAESRSQFFPDRGTWQDRPELLTLREIKDDNLPGHTLQISFKPEEELAADKLQLSGAIPFSPPKLKSIVGLMLSYRSTTALTVLFEGDFMENHGGTYRITEAVSLKKSNSDGDWNEIFIPARFEERYSKEPGAAKNPELRIMPGHLSQWPENKPVSFTLEIGSMQTVAHGPED